MIPLLLGLAAIGGMLWFAQTPSPASPSAAPVTPPPPRRIDVGDTVTVPAAATTARGVGAAIYTAFPALERAFVPDRYIVRIESVGDAFGPDPTLRGGIIGVSYPTSGLGNRGTMILGVNEQPTLWTVFPSSAVEEVR